MKSLFNIIKQHHSNDSSLIGAIHEVIEAKSRSSLRQEEGSPFKWFPDVQYVKMELSPMDLIFKLFGLKKRSEKAKMHYVKYRNKPINRFALRQIKRLKVARDTNNHELYGRMTEHLIKRSKVFFMLALYHVYPKGHRDYPFWMILNLYKKYVKLARAEDTNLEYKRVYIEKGNNKGRPLGVPTPVGRIYLHLINQFLVMKLDKKIHDSQHGFRPGRGTMTAGKDILLNLDKYPYIFEFDYKQFFPSLDVISISNVLAMYGVPQKGVTMLEKINSSLPILTEEDKVDESKYRYSEGLEMRGEYGEKGEEEAEGRVLDILKDFQEWQYDHLERHEDIPGEPTGVPQGAPTSPFLSVLTLDAVARDNFDTEAKGIRYADDGIVMMNKPRNIFTELDPDMVLAKIQYSTEKSAGVKRDGEGLKPLKFLGMEYDGNSHQGRANTRKGSRLVFDKESLLRALEIGIDKIYDEDMNRVPNPESGIKFTSSEYFGYFMSRLYTGEGNLDITYTQDFKLKYVNKSWVDQYMKGLNSPKPGSHNEFLHKLVGIKPTVFNSTSLCLHSALDALKDFEKAKFRTLKYRKKSVNKEDFQETKASIKEYELIKETFGEQYPIVAAALGKGPIIQGPKGTGRYKTQMRKFHTGKKIKGSHWEGTMEIVLGSKAAESGILSELDRLRYEQDYVLRRIAYIIGAIVGITMSMLLPQPRTPEIFKTGSCIVYGFSMGGIIGIASEGARAMKGLPGNNLEIEEIRLADMEITHSGVNSSGYAYSLIAIGVIIIAIIVFQSLPKGDIISTGVEESVSQGSNVPYGPMTFEQMTEIKKQLEDQAFIDNLIMSPIGKLWEETG